jgi:hypothetical protein
VSALDELRFGPERTLNLRESLPTSEEGVRRTESWLREQQVKGSREVLVITGRGNQSAGGISVLKPAVEKLLFSLRRRGVVASHQAHNPGAVAVELAPLRALIEAAPRRREPVRSPAPGATLHGLTRETTALLRDLAERSLDALGVAADDAGIEDEMHRYLRAIAPGLPGGLGMEDGLRAALRAAIAEYD